MELRQLRYCHCNIYGDGMQRLHSPGVIPPGVVLPGYRPSDLWSHNRMPTLNALPDVARRMVELPLTRFPILGELSIPIDGLQAPPHQDTHDVTTRHLRRAVE
ncbi:unnamed protein product [Cladocopium goreaui]|uniref:Uncharacterized protein n=1 Tax=Cladocopium goreaui TaxID=2562237 RepID=A0A9P1DH38_9DINO|nr:unnamed protein product [Cladocopium goreaui]